MTGDVRGAALACARLACTMQYILRTQQGVLVRNCQLYSGVQAWAWWRT